MSDVPLWTGPWLVAVLLLAAAGVAKVVDPGPTAKALAAAGLWPARPTGTRRGRPAGTRRGRSAGTRSDRAAGMDPAVARAGGAGMAPAVVRAGAAAEVAVAAAALAGLRAGAVLVAASYAAFVLFVLRALTRGSPLSTCGCFGRADTPPTRLHLAVNGVAAAVALLAARAGGGPSPGVVLDRLGGGQAAAFVLLALVGTGASYLVLAVLPRLRAS
ncbi:MAG TPA: MauE/DoxX family redox-associated membrane protein [Acidimicrobiales bacterium]|nr:MauE/DoxX family redox-associated membrane protein [Acidimicrobiales bacterium]